MPKLKTPVARNAPMAGLQCRLFAILAFGAGTLAACSIAQGATLTTLEATYSISLAGVTIGKAEVISRFTASGYTIAIEGTTTGLSRLISDARATLLGNGRFSAKEVIPASYNLETREAEFETHVRMSVQAGAITDLLTIPRLREAPDRIPLTAAHRRNFVDPLGAFLIVSEKPGTADGKRICERRIEVFDGWQRFDIALSYKSTRLVTGTAGAYDGRVVVCSARYIPVAGHRMSLYTTRYMAENKRLEVWYAPIDDRHLLVPYKILIGTKFGDLVIGSTRFVTTSPGSGSKTEQ